MAASRRRHVLCLCAAAPLAAWALDNGLARMPPMGWSSWNAFHRNFTEAIFYSTADEMVTNGMQAAGYEYINVDGGWWAGADTGHIARNASGFATWSASKYPHGLPALIDYIHRKGFKYGHYTDAGKEACSGDRPMSEGYERQDVALFASWGIDMLKVDACADAEKAHTIVTRWMRLLNESGRQVLFSNCRNGCLTGSWEPWCASNTNMWRTSGDIKATWASMLQNLATLRGRGAAAGPGAWNDPDLLEVGVGDFAYDGTRRSLEMSRAHFALWCVTSSPLIVAPDLATVPAPILQIFLNAAAIAVNQQCAGNAGDLLLEAGGGQVWYKPLPNGSAALVLLNPATSGPALRLALPLASLPALGGGSRCEALDVWRGSRTWVERELVAEGVLPQAARFVVLSACTAAAPLLV